ncbi:unnamed protein product [Symbiodinium sp. CCMP2592]|nr:unnamed protein product [Symbiodinium sp. CCMP2592]
MPTIAADSQQSAAANSQESAAGDEAMDEDEERELIALLEREIGNLQNEEVEADVETPEQKAEREVAELLAEMASDSDDDKPLDLLKEETKRAEELRLLEELQFEKAEKLTEARVRREEEQRERAERVERLKMEERLRLEQLRQAEERQRAEEEEEQERLRQEQLREAEERQRAEEEERLRREQLLQAEERQRAQEEEERLRQEQLREAEERQRAEEEERLRREQLLQAEERQRAQEEEERLRQEQLRRAAEDEKVQKMMQQKLQKEEDDKQSLRLRQQQVDEEARRAAEAERLRQEQLRVDSVEAARAAKIARKNEKQQKLQQLRQELEQLRNKRKTAELNDAAELNDTELQRLGWMHELPPSEATDVADATVLQPKTPALAPRAAADPTALQSATGKPNPPAVAQAPAPPTPPTSILRASAPKPDPLPQPTSPAAPASTADPKAPTASRMATQQGDESKEGTLSMSRRAAANLLFRVCAGPRLKELPEWLQPHLTGDGGTSKTKMITMLVEAGGSFDKVGAKLKMEMAETKITESMARSSLEPWTELEVREKYGNRADALMAEKRAKGLVVVDSNVTDGELFLMAKQKHIFSSGSREERALRGSMDANAASPGDLQTFMSGYSLAKPDLLEAAAVKDSATVPETKQPKLNFAAAKVQRQNSGRGLNKKTEISTPQLSFDCFARDLANKALAKSNECQGLATAIEPFSYGEKLAPELKERHGAFKLPVLQD